jgi:hypothetical protein
MANPNIKNLTTVYGNTAGVLEIQTTSTSIVSNASSSGTVYKINAIYIANTHASLDSDITIEIYDDTNTSVVGYLTKNMNVPQGNAVVPLSKDAPIYINEGFSVRLQSSVSAALSAVISYEVIS